MMSPHARAQDAQERVVERVRFWMNKAPQTDAAIAEANQLAKIYPDVFSSPDLMGSLTIADTLAWQAADDCGFDSDAFRQKYPELFGMLGITWTTRRYEGATRVVYQMCWVEEFQPRLLHRKGKELVGAFARGVEKWDDPHELADWIRKFEFRMVKGAPYLVSVSKGRQTSGETTTCQILQWVRIEPEDLIPEICYRYDVPIGQERKKEHRVGVAVPLKLAAKEE
ncbi:hypothetical protein [Haloferula sp. BvORR071]|uniref:hypothetical protein n=1 Tax=Haloferula sp. BvORR071 TaxID=1396141 RepID=UPI00054DA463|nr:hypothetical protein [Haloferula sp. BvORR071]